MTENHHSIAIVFGAGASIPPLISQQDLVQKLLEQQEDARLQLAQKYLVRTFPGLATSAPEAQLLRFEDIVGPLEIAESEEYWFHFGGRTGGKREVVLTNKQVLDSLDTWEAKALDPESLPKFAQSKNRPAVANGYSSFYAPSADSKLPYARFVHLLQREELVKRFAFLSMNYDILLDRVLYASGFCEPDYRIDGFYDPSDASNRTSDTSRVPLLKLHGSLNWRVCERCHVLRNLNRFAVWPNSGCVDCDGRFAKPMLIRPTLLKDFRHRIWKGIWREAGHIIAKAKTWIFVGYSLPMADVWMLRLLAQSVRSGGIKAEEREVIVVNPDATVKSRFSLLFPTLNFCQETFEEWIDNCQKHGGLTQ